MNAPYKSPADPLWYKDAIVYELHVRAFSDSNGDGIGDFRGIDNQYYENNFDGLAPGAVAVSYDHDPAGRARR